MIREGECKMKKSIITKVVTITTLLAIITIGYAMQSHAAACDKIGDDYVIDDLNSNKASLSVDANSTKVFTVSNLDSNAEYFLKFAAPSNFCGSVE